MGASKMEEIADAYGERKKKEVMEDAWGHLHPSDREYSGYILYTVGCYGDISCIQTHFRDLSDSPWFYDDLHNWMGSNDQDIEQGMIYLFLGSYCHKREQKFIGVITKMTAGILRDKMEKPTGMSPEPTVSNALKGIKLRVHSILPGDSVR